MFRTLPGRYCSATSVVQRGSGTHCCARGVRRACLAATSLRLLAALPGSSRVPAEARGRRQAAGHRGSTRLGGSTRHGKRSVCQPSFLNEEEERQYSQVEFTTNFGEWSQRMPLRRVTNAYFHCDRIPSAETRQFVSQPSLGRISLLSLLCATFCRSENAF